MEKLKNYIKEVIQELLHKVSWPTWPELQNSAIVVLIASVIFALIILAMDQTSNVIMKIIYSLAN